MLRDLTSDFLYQFCQRDSIALFTKVVWLSCAALRGRDRYVHKIFMLAL